MIKKLLPSKSYSPCTSIKTEDGFTSSAKETANVFNDYFTSIGSNLADKFNDVHVNDCNYSNENLDFKFSYVTSDSDLVLMDLVLNF